MTSIDDSNTTPPGYWFGEIESRLRDRMREELRDLGLRRGGWRVLHALADGPATAEELADRLPHGRRHGRGRTSVPEWMHGSPDRMRAGREWMHSRRGAEGAQHHQPHHEHEHDYPDRDQARYEHPHHAHPHHEHPHHEDRCAEHDRHDGRPADSTFERGFERGFVRGFDRGTGFHRPPFGPFGGRPFGPVPPFAHRHGHGRSGMVDRILSEFVERGWVWFDGDRATLTEEGRAAHDAAFERVGSVRSSLADGISEADLATTLATLQTMARNLGWTPKDEAKAPAAPAEADDTAGQTKAGGATDTGTDTDTDTDTVR